MINKLIESFDGIKNGKKLIHCITNPISINQCANTVLALGNKPIMAEHPKEVYDITLSSDSLLVNIGNITDVRMKSIKIACRAANIKNIPIVFDAVGVACSSMRKAYAKKIIKKYKPAVIKGNYSEIYALYQDEYKAKGVDSEELDTEKIISVSDTLAKKLNCTILASGKTDVVACNGEYACISNGVKQLSDITGTGCMLGALTATILPSTSAYLGAVLACAVLGIAGEKAYTDGKNGTFMVRLIDELSTLDAKDIEEKIKLEVKPNERA